MIHMEQEKKYKFKGKNILVVGLARSGTGAANLLAELGARVSITDKKSPGSLADQIKRLLPSVKFVEEDKTEGIIDSLDMIVISPGVPLYIPLLVKAHIKGIPVIGELELAYQAVRSYESRGVREKENTGSVLPISGHTSPVPFIGITGTNGKSTTTTLVDLMLKEAGYTTLLAGNIGNALTEEILRRIRSQEPGAKRGEGAFAPATLDHIVLEISSFQLETIEEFRPHIAAILNITPDHLDRYEGMKDYAEAKARILENQTAEDYLILNADDPEIKNIESENVQGKSEKPKILYFSRMNEVEGIYCKDGVVCCTFRNPEFSLGVSSHSHESIELIRVDEIKIKGVHNLENAMAASLMALVSGCGPDEVRHVLKKFPGLEHRLEFVDDINGVRFINDSKGTNVGAVAKSLADFENIILIMGGLDKGSDFSVLGDLMKSKVKLLILIGAAADVIAGAIGSVTETRKVSGLGEAVSLSMSRASAGDIVLLSPGCASFDMFKDFEDRGRKFKEAVKALKMQLSEIQHEY
ncbi:MAG TPA: UDP-N-acetylmuramoyl-L-alanine--D-glutamate ligase [Nitrospiraceae bacterium]|nr:UDP-N-acetylmuramoyl-L-alanine--D-glutamate ligase [Nitrospiraceae bacterium]